VDGDALRAFLAPLAEPSKTETFKFSRAWLRGEAVRVTDPRTSNLGRRLNLPPSYVLIHRVSTEGIGVLCQLESEGRFRAEIIGRIPGYADEEGTGSLGDGLGSGPHDDRHSTGPRDSQGAGSGEGDEGTDPLDDEGAGAVTPGR
jgi:hypothetical protein